MGKLASEMQIPAPRLIRLRDAPYYLGMDRNRFNAEARPTLTAVPIGRQGIAFDRLELDAWVDDYISRNGRRLKASKLEDDVCQRSKLACRGSAKGTGSGTSKSAADTPRGGWLHESTGTSSRDEAERILIRRLAKLEEEATGQADALAPSQDVRIG